MKRKLLMLTALALCLALLCGCTTIATSEWMQNLFPVGDEAVAAQQTGSVNGSEDKQEVKQVVTETYTALESFGLAYQPDYGLQPYNCQSLNNRIIFSFLYEPLFAVTSSYEAEPILAESYFVTDDGRTTTVKLRSGVTFHDGSALTAADAAYSIESAAGSEYYGSRLRFITSAEAQDDLTLVLSTSEAYECLPLLLDIPIIKSGTKDEVSPPGTGPYEFAGTKLTRCENWWRDTAPLVDFDEIALTVSSTAADVRDNFEYQKVNMVLTDPNSSAFAGFHNDYELWNEETTIMQYIGYNMNSPVFSNYGLRGAITFAIDREQLVEQTLGGFAVASTLPCSPNSRYYDVKLANSFAYDTGSYYDQLASASVEDATGDGILDLYVPSKGYSVPVEGTMLVCSSSYIRVQAANEAAKMLNSLGFNITVKSMEYTEYKQALLQGNFDLYYGEVRLSPNFDLSPFFGATGTLNYGDLSDSTMMNLCSMALVNSGNTYNLYKRVCERGYITPILFKSYALYTTRGAVTEPTHYIDWFLPYTPEEGN